MHITTLCMHAAVAASQLLRALPEKNTVGAQILHNVMKLLPLRFGSRREADLLAGSGWL